MIESEQDRLERELRELAPAKLPDEFSERLSNAWNPGNPVPAPRQRARASVDRLSWLRWLAPAAAAVAAALALVAHSRHEMRGNRTPSTPSVEPAALNASDVEIDRRLVASFNAVATLPGGEPVQVQCREWMDQVVLRDAARGVAIQQRTPRFEIIPVRFETF